MPSIYAQPWCVAFDTDDECRPLASFRVVTWDTYWTIVEGLTESQAGAIVVAHNLARSGWKDEGGNDAEVYQSNDRLSL